MTKYQKYIIVCEGKSEYQYIQKLRHFLNENGLADELNLIPKNAGGVKNVLNVCRGLSPSDKKECLIWIDRDVFLQSSKEKRYPCRVLYSYVNFEDFLVMHLSADKVLAWQKVCDDHDHFSSPIKYESRLFKDNYPIPSYGKGGEYDLISPESLRLLFKHNKDKNIKFKSGFADFLEEVLSPLFPSS